MLGSVMGGWGLGAVQMKVVMYVYYCLLTFLCRVRNVWDRRSLCGHCRVILPTYLPPIPLVLTLDIARPSVAVKAGNCQDKQAVVLVDSAL